MSRGESVQVEHTLSPCAGFQVYINSTFLPMNPETHSQGLIETTSKAELIPKYGLGTQGRRGFWGLAPHLGPRREDPLRQPGKQHLMEMSESQA